MVVLGLLAWGGQTISLVAPGKAQEWNLVERKDAVDPVFWSDIRGEALWDAFTLWPLVVAGALLFLDNAGWPYFGLVGGSTYIYFAGRGILTRHAMRREGVRIGDPGNVRLGMVMLAVWGVLGLVSVVAAVVAMSTS